MTLEEDYDDYHKIHPYGSKPVIYGDGTGLPDWYLMPKLEDAATINPDWYKQEESPKDKQVGGSHYKDMAIQPGEFITKNNIPWYEGNAIKYICRHKQKGGKQDLEKALHYLQLAIDEYYD